MSFNIINSILLKEEKRARKRQRNIERQERKNRTRSIVPYVPDRKKFKGLLYLNDRKLLSRVWDEFLAKKS